MKADFEKTRVENTVAHRVHCFNKEKTTQIKKIPCKHKIHVEKIISSTLQTKKKLYKKYAHCKQNSYTLCKPKRNCKKICTLQTKGNTRCKHPARSSSSILQTRKKLFKKIAYWKQKNYTLQTANKSFSTPELLSFIT